MNDKLIIYGAGGHAKVVADAALSSGWEVIAFADDDPQKQGTRLLDIPVSASGIDECVSLAKVHQAQVVLA